MKWNAYNFKLMHEDKTYMLLYEDGNQALFMPGQTKDFFELSKYKEELGRDYGRLCLYLCIAEDFDCVWDFNTIRSDEKVSLVSIIVCLF